jgi:crotonobetainyl-CoA:carnitine CoA-transferase CaiB-like acyl-CoA transferase
LADQAHRYKAYEDIRILDMSRVLAGPWAGQMMADLGAEVIKIERPVAGDDSRHWGPPFLTDREGRETREAAYFMCANRGKKSVTVDISRSEGQRLIRALAAKCDVLIENYKVGDLARYGLGYEDLKAVNPNLIYCSVTGFGQTGPNRHLAGYDFMIQAMGGLMSLTGHGDAEPGGGPMKVGVPVADLMTGMYAAIAIQAALARRARNGGGEWIDLALLDCQVAMLANQGQNYLSGDGGLTPRMGNSHPNVAPYEAFPTSDGHLVMTVGTDYQFRKFCNVIGRTDLLEDSRFATNPDRIGNRAVLSAQVKSAMVEHTTAHWLVAFGEAGVPCGPIHTLTQVYEMPQVKAREMVFYIDHPLAGPVPLTANPIHFREEPLRHEVPPPTLGQHTRQVLSGVLGMTEAEMDRLASEKAI